MGIKAEKVRHSDVRPGSPVYITNPIEYPGSTAFRAGDPDILPDDYVWTLFESTARYNPWLRKEVNGPLGQVRRGTTHALDGLDDHAR